MIEVTTEDIVVDIDNNIDVNSTGSIDVVITDNKDLDITVSKKEFVITGDNIYVPVLYDDVPQWMKDLVSLAVNQAIEGVNTNNLDQLNSMLTSFATSYVPLNQYTQSILDLSNADVSLHAVIETLNSNYNDGINHANSQIIQLQNTKASKDEVVTQVVNTLAAQLSNPKSDIGAIVARLDQAIATTNSASATSYEALTATLDSIEDEVSGNATAIHALEASVTNINGTLTSHASDITHLRTDLNSGTGTWATADATVTNTLNTNIVNNRVAVEAKWAYNSTVNINGIYKKSGFGLTTNYTSGNGTEASPYTSEFWIDASRLKFTNSAQTGQTAPFTIDASGANPQIKFNGVVNFSNITNTTGTGSNLLYNSAPKIGSETKGWYVWTNSGMAVNLSAGWNEWKPTGGSSVAANIGGNPSIGSVYDVGQSLKFPVIAGSRYEASAYISAHRSNSYVSLIFYDTAGNYVGEASGNVINYAGSNALVNWGRSSMFTTAPGNAATALLIIRSIVTGNNPYCFVANAFAGVAEANQTTPSNWSEGTSAGATYTSELSNDAGYVLPAGVANAINTNTTTINGSKITTGSITANQVNLNNLFAQNITYTGVITGGNVAGGGIIRSYNGNMEIDLVNGSIYIA